MNDVRIKKRRLQKTENVSTGSGRRKFIKTLVLGSGALVVGGMLTKSENILSLTKSAGDKLSNFRLIERGNEMVLHDKNGDEILVVEKNA